MGEDLEIEYDAEDDSEFKRQIIERIVNHHEAIVVKSEAIEKSFDSILTSNRSLSDFTPLFQSIEMVFVTEVPDTEERQNLSEALVNAVANLSPDTVNNISENLSESDELVSILVDLNNQYQRSLIGAANSIQQGPRWWSNIETSSGIRSDSVSFEHRISVGFNEEFTFNSGMRASLHLVQHILEHLNDAPDLLGEDSLSELSLESIEAVEEEIQELKERSEEYQDELIQEEDTESETDQE